MRQPDHPIRHDPDNTLVFVHIPKAAGMTMRQVVARQYIGQPQYIFNAQNTYKVERFLELSESDRAQLRYVGGHVSYGIHRFIPKPVTYITMLRDPRDHLISYYHYARKTPTASNHKRIKDATFEQFIQMPRMHAVQLDMIVGYDDQQNPKGKWRKHYNRQRPIDERLALAEAHLRTHFAVVGLVEHFDESMLHLQQQLGWTNVYYTLKNVNLGRPRGDDATAPYRALIEAYAQPDIALYELACRIFAEQRAQYNGDLDADLQRYRRRNSLYSRAWRISRGVRDLPLYRKLRRTLARS